MPSRQVLREIPWPTSRLDEVPQAVLELGEAWTRRICGRLRLGASHCAPEIYERMQGTVWGQRSWELLGKRVSSKCLATILGVRPQRFKTAGSGKLDRRYRCFGAESRQESSVLKPRECCKHSGTKKSSSEEHARGRLFLEMLCAAGWNAAHPVPCHSS